MRGGEVRRRPQSRKTVPVARRLTGRELRAQEEQLLDWLRRRDAGESSASIARGAGVTPERVRTATQRIRDEDLAQSGEDPGACYDWSRPILPEGFGHAG